MVPAVAAPYQSLADVDRAKAVIGCGLMATVGPILMGLLIVHGRLVYPVFGIRVDTPEIAAFAVALFYGGLHAVSLLMGIATFVVSLAMKQGGCGKPVVYLGVVTAVADVAGAYPDAIGPVLTLLSQVVFTAWFLAVGAQLYRRGHRWVMAAARSAKPVRAARRTVNHCRRRENPVRLRPTAIAAVLVPSILAAQTAPQRQVHHDTLMSKADPAASLVVAKAFQYAGGQTIDILKVAGAEQHVFIDAALDHSIRRFYWIQFEHYYPDNTDTYDYTGIEQKPVQIGRLAFMGDVRVSPDFFTMDDRPGSDSKAAETFLRGRGFKLDGTFVNLRLFHLPDATNRRELMIIYGEILPAGASEGKLTSEITAHARSNLTIP